VDGVFFTGSVATGKKIAEAVRGPLVKLQLELGGKDPIYVCEDVDLAKAAAGIADGAFYNTGQSCCSVERIYVHEKVFAPFVDAFVAEVRRYKRGDPPTTDLHRAAHARPAAEGARGAGEGRGEEGREVSRAASAQGQGNWFEPTVLVDVDHSMAVMREESFGPIIGLMPAKDDAEAVRLMNDTDYGLTAGVYTPERTAPRRSSRR
jgi:acyl-CoA reductase-like NAD-dependent aldehyde dehydrogenase